MEKKNVHDVCQATDALSSHESPPLTPLSELPDETLRRQLPQNWRMFCNCGQRYAVVDAALSQSEGQLAKGKVSVSGACALSVLPGN